VSKPTLLNPYCTLSDAQAEAGTTDDASADELIVEINKASRWIDEHCNRDFLYHNHASSPLVVSESWCAGNVIYLPWPVLTLTEITIGTATFAATEYRVTRRPGSATSKIERNGTWLPEEKFSASPPVMAPQITLRGTFGFTPAATNPAGNPSPEIPATIVQACAAIAAIRSGQVRKEINIPGGGREAVTVRAVPKPVMDSLGKFRISVV
jgi:hypothetical protein